jgi:hypothetical protein
MIHPREKDWHAQGMRLMSTRATVRVKSAETGRAGRPEKQQLESTAKILEGLGFDVLRVGRFGVSIEGSDERFAEVFGVQVPPSKSLVASVNPQQKELADLVDLLEVAPEAKQFG